MRKYLSFLILALSLLFCQCKKTNPCEDGGELYCTGTDYGVARLDTAGKWPTESISNKLFFTNGNSSSPVYLFELKAFTDEVFRDVLATHSEPRTCGTAYCDDFCSSEHEIAFYRSDNAPFSIDLRREKDYYEYLPGITREKVEKAKDRLMVNIRNKADTINFSFRVRLDKKDTTDGYRFRDSLQLGNWMHKNVYEIYYSRPAMSIPYIKGIYYTTGVGLVGYYYSNEQVWYVK